LTVLFIDLVGSTELGRALDPEDLVVLLRQFREACVATIAAHEGYIAQYLGDGILRTSRDQRLAPEARQRLMLDTQLKLGATLAIQRGPQSDESNRRS
jgi:class 3 adenylate cyclase